MKKSSIICTILCITLSLLFFVDYPLRVFAQTYTPPTEAVVDTGEPVEDKSRRTQYLKEYILADGTRQVLVYPEAVHYEENGKWEEIDNSLKTLRYSGQTVYTNRAGGWSVTLPQKLSAANSIIAEKDGHVLELSIGGQLTTSSGNMELNSAKEYNSAILHTATDHSALQYASVFGTADLRYDLTGQRLKESVILKDRPTQSTTYEYILKLTNLVPRISENKDITLYSTTDGSAVFVLPAPNMIDNNGEESWDIDLTFAAVGSVYRLSYTPSFEWLTADERAYPVIIDPVIECGGSATNISDQHVASKATIDYRSTRIEAGYSVLRGIERIYLMFNNLPALKTTDVIVEAKVKLNRQYNSSLTSQMNVHRVNSTWTASSLQWSNKPSYNTQIADYAMVKDAGEYTWDVTSIVLGWYETGVINNTGMMFKLTDEIENSGTSSDHNKTFYSSDDSGTLKPALEIHYRSFDGLEADRAYSEWSAEAAGSGAVDLFTGNLYWTFMDMGVDGIHMPVEINHVYSAADTADTFGVGKGWRTNFHQRVYSLAGNTQYYVWEDGDGTKHYFKKSGTNTYTDTELMRLTLQTNITGYDYTAKIRTEAGEEMHFDSSGRLIRIKNNQQTSKSINITYSSGNLISSVTDGGGRVYSFTYSNGRLSTITYKGSDNGAYITTAYTYTDGTLTGVSNSELAADSVYTYSGTKLTSAAYGATKVNVTYNAHGQAEQVFEAYVTTNAGKKQLFEYREGRTKITDFVRGNANASEATISYCVFDKYGNATGAYDREGNVSYTTYTHVQDKSLPVYSGSEVLISRNYIPNAGFENGNYWTCYVQGTTVGGSWGRTTEQKHTGSYSMKISRTANDTGRYMVQPTGEAIFTVEKGHTYTFSAYIKTTGMDGNGKGACLVVEPAVSSIETKYSEPVKVNTDWTRYSVSYTLSEDAPTNVLKCFFQNKSGGTAYFDDLQFEMSPVSGQVNLIDNDNFTYGNATYGWTKNSACTHSGDGLQTTYMESTGAFKGMLTSPAYMLVGDVNQQKQVTQTVSVSGVAGDVFQLGGWMYSSGTALHGGGRVKAGISMRFNYTDGTASEWFDALYNGEDEWDHVTAVGKAQKAYSSVTVALRNEYNSYALSYDGIRLIKNPAVTFTQYSNNRVSAVTDEYGNTTTYNYDTNGNVTSTTSSNVTTTNTYDGNHNLTGSTSVLGTQKQFTAVTYDTYGNTLAYKILDESEDVAIESGDVAIENNFTYNGNYVASATDELRQTTAYSYNQQLGLLTSVTRASDTATNYTYDSMHRTRMVSKAATGLYGGKSTADVTYTYENDSLKSVYTSGATGLSTQYTFNYDPTSIGGTVNYASGQLTSINVGSTELISHTYSPTTNYLQSSTYANGDKVEYKYDGRGREILREWFDAEGVRTEKYVFTYERDVHTQTEYTKYYTSSNIDRQLRIEYDYDSQLRPTRIEEYDLEESSSTPVKVQYYVYNGDGTLAYVAVANNKTGNIQKITQLHDEWKRLTGVTYTTEQDDGITSSTQSTTHNITYDAYGRISTGKIRTEADEITTTYGYYAPDTTHTTNLIASLRVDSTGSYDKTWEYTYDANGNITSVTVNGATTSYAYDELGQLIRENNQAAGKTWTYSYDTAGNIRFKREYDYTPGELGGITPSNTRSYGYSNVSWGDQLTSVDGVTYTYDESGNLTRRGDLECWWSHGRQLTYFGDEYEGNYYEYDENGMRVKRTHSEPKGDTEYTYFYAGEVLTALFKKTFTGIVKSMHIEYDTVGKPMCLMYNGTKYTYALNAQGDVVALLDGEGTAVVEYTYDAWGSILTCTGTLADSLGKDNPLRYRGYVYDEETGLYYLQTRYYDPEIGRFISADGQLNNSLLGYNMYAYCENNPVMRADHGGAFWDTVFDVVSLVFSIIDVAFNPDDAWAWVGVAADVASLIIPFATGGGIIVDVLTKSDEVVDAVGVVRKTENAIDAVDDLHDTGKTVSAVVELTQGWKVGDDITALTKAGKKPSWTTVRQRFWKNEAFYNAWKYSNPEDLNRMKKGLAPIGPDGFSMELHHPYGRNGSNFFIFEPISRTLHRRIHYGH